MENRLLIAAAVGLFGGFGLSHLHALESRLSELEGGGSPADELDRVRTLLARLELRFGALQEELELRAAEFEDRELELGRWRERYAENLSQRVETRLSEVDRGARERWSSLEAELSAAALLARETEARLSELSPCAPDGATLWKDLMAPTVQLAGEGTVGTGVLLPSEPGEDGAWSTPLLTAWHVVRDILAEDPGGPQVVPVRMYESDGSASDQRARLLRYDPTLDVALLELETTERIDRGARLASRARLASLQTFDPVYAVGCPLGNDPIPTWGSIADAHHEVEGSRYWMVSSPTYIGNSGGGIFDARSHELVGIFSKIYTHGSLRPTVVPHMGLATPLDDVYDWLEAEGIVGLAPSETEGLRAGEAPTVPAASPLGATDAAVGEY